MTISRKEAVGAILISTVAVVAFQVHDQSVNETARARFQNASAGEQWASIKRGNAYVGCVDRATGTIYTPEGVTEDFIKSENLTRNGCFVYSNGSPMRRLAP